MEQPAVRCLVNSCKITVNPTGIQTFGWNPTFVSKTLKIGLLGKIRSYLL